MTGQCHRSVVIGMTATLPRTMIPKVSAALGMIKPRLVTASPDRPNIFLGKECKVKTDVFSTYEEIFIPECHALLERGSTYPVTLFYMPMEWIAEANLYCMHIFGGPGQVTYQNCTFGALFSTQDPALVEVICGELCKPNPRIRLVFCTSSIGMGFDSPSVSRVLHAKPPRTMIDYVQQIGRCGRAGQPAKAILYHSARDIASNVRGIDESIVKYCTEEVGCLREKLLEPFGFKPDDIQLCQCCSNCAIKCSCPMCSSEPMEQ